jgi:hypothetical protein
MEIEFWQQIGEISHAEIQEPDLCILAVRMGTNWEPLTQDPPSALLYWAYAGAIETSLE